jgi:ATP-dependent Clp protease ATP-binding subunit ClpA
LIASSGDDFHPWTTYLDAREEARRRGDHKVDTEHLVLALLMEPGLAGALGVDLQTARAALEALDRDALGAVGVVVRTDAPPLPTIEAGRRPRKPTIKNVWEGRLPLTPSAKVVLQESSKEMRGFRGHHLGPQHVLAALLELERPDPAAELFARLGVDRTTTRERLGES